MADIINIVVHPGYCVNHDDYDEEVYYEQIDKGTFNIFLHPTCDDLSRKIVLRKFLREVMIEACKNRSIEEIEKLTKNEECDNVNVAYAGWTVRRLMFDTHKSLKKVRKIRTKRYHTKLKRLIMSNEKFILKYLYTISKVRPIIHGDNVSYKYMEFRKTLEDKYKDSDKQFNAHLDGLYYNDFTRAFQGLVTNNLEPDDKIFVFGEYYNQCVNGLTVVLDKMNVEYEVIPELCVFNTMCPTTGKDLNIDNKHFLVVGNDNEQS